MRISMDRDDPDYCAFGIYAKVLLDGVPIKYCVTADTEAGIVVCYEFPYRIENNEVAREIKNGKVEIEWVNLPPGITEIEVLEYKDWNKETLSGSVVDNANS